MPTGKYPLKHRDERRAVAQLFIEYAPFYQRNRQCRWRPFAGGRGGDGRSRRRQANDRGEDCPLRRIAAYHGAPAYVLSKPRAANATVFIEAYVRLIGAADKSLRESPLRPRP
jgi:hypothetical protein